MIAICLFAFGFADFTLITLHAAKMNVFPEAALSLLYAAAMAVDAFAALFFGWLFDRIGLKALILGSWLLGALYDVNPVYLVIVSVAVQILAIVFYMIGIRRSKLGKM